MVVTDRFHCTSIGQVGRCEWHGLAWTTPSHYLKQCWNIVNWPLGNKLQWTFDQAHTFSFKKMHLKLSSVKWRPFCLGPNVLNIVVEEKNTNHYQTCWIARCYCVPSMHWYIVFQVATVGMPSPQPPTWQVGLIYSPPGLYRITSQLLLLRTHNAKIMSLSHQNIAVSFWCNNNVVIALCVHWVMNSCMLPGWWIRWIFYFNWQYWKCDWTMNINKQPTNGLTSEFDSSLTLDIRDDTNTKSLLVSVQATYMN